MNTYSRLRDGTWGISVDRPNVRPGERVQVTRKNGQVRRETVDRVLWTDGRRALCSVVRDADTAPQERNGAYAPASAPPAWDQVGPIERAYAREFDEEQAAAARGAEATRVQREARERVTREAREREAAIRADEDRIALERATREAREALDRAAPAAREAAIARVREAARAGSVGATEALARVGIEAALAGAARSAAEIPARRAAVAAAPTTPARVIERDVVLAGAGAEGNGALVGWSGLGSLSRSEILATLADASLPAEWAPRSKSAVAHAGEVLGRLNLRGYVSRRAKTPAPRPGERRRDWAARWTVVRVDAANAGVGDSAGAVVLTVELRRESDELAVDGDAQLGASVLREYRELRDGEVYQAGDVTSWAVRLLRVHTGATPLGVGYYVPHGGRDVASRLAAALSARWGAGWICPLLPVATSQELRIGIARGLSDEVDRIGSSLARERAAATEASRADVSPAVAARLLRDLEAAQDRLAAYRALCGDDVIRPVAVKIAGLYATLGALADDASQRFALLDLDSPIAAPVAPIVSPAERSADAALAVRRTPAAPVAPVARPEPERPEPRPDQDERFSLIELD